MNDWLLKMAVNAVYSKRKMKSRGGDGYAISNKRRQLYWLRRLSGSVSGKLHQGNERDALYFGRPMH